MVFSQSSSFLISTASDTVDHPLLLNNLFSYEFYDPTYLLVLLARSDGSFSMSLWGSSFIQVTSTNGGYPPSLYFGPSSSSTLVLWWSYQLSGFNDHLYAEDTQIYLASPNLSLKLQTHIYNSLQYSKLSSTTTYWTSQIEYLIDILSPICPKLNSFIFP